MDLSFLDNTSVYLWLFGGLALMILEIFVPGIFLIFLGIAAVITAGFIKIFDIGFYAQILCWSILSAALVFTIGQFFKKLFPSYKSMEPLQEDLHTGKIVEVTERIIRNKKGGRIKFQGTFWEAGCLDEDIGVGEYAIILSRNNLAFIVRKANSEEVKNYIESKKKSDDFLV